MSVFVRFCARAVAIELFRGFRCCPAESVYLLEGLAQITVSQSLIARGRWLLCLRTNNSGLQLSSSLVLRINEISLVNWFTVGSSTQQQATESSLIPIERP